MKKKILTLLMALAVSVWSLGVQAQTDVTSTYLLNPSFELSAEGTNYSSATVISINGNSSNSLYGWTIPALGTSFSNVEINTSGGSTGSGYGTATASDGNYYYFNRRGWGNSVDVKLESTTLVPVPAGRYYITCDYKSSEKVYHGSTISLSVLQNNVQLGTSGTVGVASVTENKTYFNDTPWKTVGAWFNVETAGTCTVSIGESLLGDNGRADIILDNIRLFSWPATTESECLEYASETFPYDLTAKVVNPYFNSDISGWTITTTAQNKTLATNQLGAFSGRFLENWNGSAYTGKIYQTISNLPAGNYMVKAAVFGSNATSGSDALVLFANSGTTSVTSATPSFYTATGTVGIDGILEFGVEATTALSNWIGVDNFSLYCTGLDVSALSTQLQGLITTASNTSSSTIPNSLYSILQTEIVKANEALGVGTVHAVNVAIADMSEIIETVNVCTTAFASLNTFITTCTGISTNSVPDATSDKTTFDAAIATATTDADAQTTVAGLNNVMETLEAARRVYVLVADPINSTSFDYTFLIPDATITTGSAWTNVRTNSGQQYTGAPDNLYFDKWNNASAEDTYTELTGLPSGLYQLKAAGRASASCTSAYIYATGASASEQAEIEKNGNSGAELGNGWSWYTTASVSSAGNLKIGFYANTTGSQWAGADDFHLFFYGYDVASALSSLNTLIADAKTLMNSPLNFQGAVSEALHDKMTAAQTEYDAITHTKASVTTAYDELLSAYNDADASIQAYAALNTAITTVTGYAAAGLSSEITTAQGIYDGCVANTAEVNAATADLYAAMESYASTLGNTAPLDLTSYYLVNGDFSNGTTGWTKTGSFTASHTWSVSENVLSFVPASGHYTGCSTWQTVTLPAGSYKLSAEINAGEISGKATTLFAATSAMTWNNILNDVLASKDVSNYGEWETLSIIFSLTAETDVLVGVNATAYNNAAGSYASHSIKNFKLEQSKNQIENIEGEKRVVGTWTKEEIEGITIDATTTALNFTNITIPENSTVTVTNQPNCLVFTTDATNLSCTGNVVENGVCDNLNINEGHSFASPFDFTATTLSYGRSFAANWLTVCLPFAYTLPEGVKAETLGSIDLAKGIFTFDEATGTLEANKPYIIKNSSETAALFGNLSGQSIVGTPESMKFTVTGAGDSYAAEFIGTYNTVTSTELCAADAINADGYDVLFFSAAGELYYVTPSSTATITFKPFRAYIRIPAGTIDWSSLSAIKVRHGVDDLTSIEPIELKNIDDEEVIYDLNGRKVKSTTKGNIYIINGKKVLK